MESALSSSTVGGVTAVVAGSGEPALLFVHGVACAGEDWEKQIEVLSPRYRCIAIDLPGHGGSPPPKERTIAALADAVVQAKEESGADKVVLIGHSMGARLIRQAYRVSPGRVAGMVFVDSALFVGDMEDNIRRMRGLFETLGYERQVTTSFGQMFVDDRDPALKERIVRRALRLDAALGQDLPVDIIRWDLTHGRHDMPAIKVPALVIQSSLFDDKFRRAPLREDSRTPFMDMAEGSIPDVRLRVVTGVGHFPMIEAADEVNRHLGDFVAGLA